MGSLMLSGRASSCGGVGGRCREHRGCVTKHLIYQPPHRTPSSPSSLSLFPALAWSVTKAGAEETGLCVISAALFSAGGSCYARLAALRLAGSWGVFGCCAGKSGSRLLWQRAAGGFLNCGFITSNRCGFENFSFEACSLFKRLWWKFALQWMCGKMVFSK